MTKLLYIGTWLHIQIVNDFPDINEFICVDTQPRGEWDDNTYKPQYFCKNFFHQLVIECEKNGFQLTDKRTLDFLFPEQELANPTRLTFRNEQRIIQYYISTNFLYNMNSNLEKDMKECDGLIVSGYFPNIKLLEYLKKPIDYYGYDETCYGVDDEEPKISDVLLEENNYFRNYYVVRKRDGVMGKVDRGYFYGKK